MSVTRRLFIASALGLAFLGSKAFAEEKSPLGEFLSNVKDKAMKDFMERHDKDGRWDGKYYYDPIAKTTNAIRATNGARN